MLGAAWMAKAVEMRFPNARTIKRAVRENKAADAALQATGVPVRDAKPHPLLL